jgi:hypothetical protein
MAELNNHAERAHALLSASSSSRWLKCPPSALAASMYPSQDTVYTREGTLAHEVAEAVVRAYLNGSPGAPFFSDPEVTPEMIECAVAYSDYIQEQIQSPDAVVLLEQRLDFSTWVPDGFGTGDCLILQGHRLDVIDYKYGQGVAVSAEGNSQMRLYGLGALHDFGLLYDVTEVHLHIFQPRKDNISVEHLSIDGLLAWGDVVRPVAEQASTGGGAHCAGAHCRFCPHAGACPALASSCLAWFERFGHLGVDSLSALDVAEILAQAPMINAWLKSVEDRALSALMDGAEIPGYKVVSGRTLRRWADELEVVDVLTKAGYTREEITKTEVLSPAALERVLGKKRAAELVAGHVLSIPGAPTLAPVSDKRPVYDRLAEAKKDFT